MISFYYRRKPWYQYEQILHKWANILGHPYFKLLVLNKTEQPFSFFIPIFNSSSHFLYPPSSTFGVWILFYNGSTMCHLFKIASAVSSFKKSFSTFKLWLSPFTCVSFRKWILWFKHSSIQSHIHSMHEVMNPLHFQKQKTLFFDVSRRV